MIIDADAITRQLQEPGQPVLAAIVERFGSGHPHGRAAPSTGQALAELVFNDPDALKDLNGHRAPGRRAEIARRIDVERDSDRVVVLDVPLLVETGRRGLAGVVVVDAPLDVAVDRLVRDRGMSEADARARMARQASREERLRPGRPGDRQRRRPGPTWSTRSTELWAWLQTLPPPPTARRPPPDRPPADPPDRRPARRRRSRHASAAVAELRESWPAAKSAECELHTAGLRLDAARLPIRPARRTHPGDGIAPLTDLGPMGPSHGAGRAPARRGHPSPARAARHRPQDGAHAGSPLGVLAEPRPGVLVARSGSGLVRAEPDGRDARRRAVRWRRIAPRPPPRPRRLRQRRRPGGLGRCRLATPSSRASSSTRCRHWRRVTSRPCAASRRRASPGRWPTSVRSASPIGCCRLSTMLGAGA